MSGQYPFRDTIFALSSGGLPSGVAVIRLSGPHVRDVLQEVAGRVPPARQATLMHLWDGDGRPLDHGLVPLVHGDVALDDVRGGTIVSTESIFRYLSAHLPVSRILLLGEVKGVYDSEGTVIPEITPANIERYAAALGGSSGTDVTGGMLTKVLDMLDLVISHPGLTVRILDGREPGLLGRTLRGEINVGTLIRA